MSQKIGATENRCHKTQSTFITQQCCAGSFNFCTTKLLQLLVLLLYARMRNPLNILRCSAYKVEQFSYSRTGSLAVATKITPTFTLQCKSRDSSLHATHISTISVPITGQIPKCKPNVCTHTHTRHRHVETCLPTSLINQVTQHCCWNFSQTSTSISEVFLRPARLILWRHL